MDVTRKSARKWIDSLSLRVQQALFAAAAYLILLAICLLAISPEQYDLSVGDVAPKTITASKDIVDELTTERRRRAAADAVSPVYYKDDTVSYTVLSDMDAVFSELRAVRELGEQIRNAWGDEGGSFTEADYAQASGLVTRLSLSNYQLRTLMNTGESDFESLYQSLVSATRTTLVSTITEGQINDAINNIQQIVSYNTRTDLWYNVAIPTLRASLKANMLIDQAATEENRQKACDAVEPTVYKQDQNIVVKGDRVTAEQIAVLESLGLLEGNSFDYPLYIGTAITLALILASAYLYAYLFAKPMLSMGPSALVLLIAGVLTVLLCLLMGEYLNINAMPVALGAMLVVNLLGARPAYVTNMALTLIITLLTAKGTGLVTSQTMSVLLTCSLGGLVAIWMMRKNTTRVMVVVSGLVVGTVNFGVLVCVRALTSSDMSGVWTDMAYAIGGAVVSAVLCVGLQPILETAFNLVTPSKLIELSNPNQPLLRRLMIETPGTYHHSMVVANLAEAAAEAVGANALLARVGAYYHDIGKLIRPMYFKENQIGENPHEHTNPYVSAAIVTAHTRDGLIMAQQYHLPQEIQDVIIEHHGDTPVMYFYHKALQQADGQAVDIADFRYDGKRPHTRETAIIMLADTVEAAVRSMPDPTPKAIEEFIARLVRSKLDDGQLDNAPITLKDISKICEAFSTVLNGVFHERIEYPTISPSAAAHVAAHTTAKLPQGEESAVEEKELRRIDLDEPAAERAAEEIVDAQTQSQQPAVVEAGPAKPQENAVSGDTEDAGCEN